MTRTKKSNDYVPQNYDDLYRYYIGDVDDDTLCRQIMRKMLRHATEDERETLAADVFLRIFEKKLIENYDPSKANFGGVIFFVTRSIVVNHLDRKQRNPLTGLNRGSLVETSPDDEVWEPGTYSLDRLFDIDIPDQEGQLDAKNLVTRLIKWAQGLKETGKSKRDQSILPMLEAMMKGEDPKDLTKTLDVTPSTIYNWLEFIQNFIKGEQEAPAVKMLPYEDDVFYQRAWKIIAPKVPFQQSKVAALKKELEALQAAPRHKRDASLNRLFELLDAGEDPIVAAKDLGVAPSTVTGWCAYMRSLVQA